MLTFNLKKEWFEKIKSGEKTHEYRQENINFDKENELLYRTLEKIEKFCNKILADILHYSQGTINTAEKIHNIIKEIK